MQNMQHPKSIDDTLMIGDSHEVNNFLNERKRMYSSKLSRIFQLGRVRRHHGGAVSYEA